MTIVAPAHLTRSELRINGEASGRRELVRDDLEALGLQLSVSTDLQVGFPGQTQTIELEAFAGGGAVPGDGDPFILSQERGFRVPSPLEAGRVNPVIIWIPFDPTASVADPVPFGFELTVEP